MCFCLHMQDFVVVFLENLLKMIGKSLNQDRGELGPLF